MSQKLCGCSGVRPLVYLLVILFGISSWVDINGLWVELPVLVQNLPEGWDLPSYMAVIIQIANVAPLLYTVTSAIWPHKILEVPVIYSIILIGAISCLLLSFFWKSTTYVAGSEHSTALFVLQFFLALVDCTSSVAFLPFMSLLKPQYMTAYFIGEGFSGLVPSILALIQGAGSMKCVNFSNYDVNTTFSQYIEKNNSVAAINFNTTSPISSFSIYPKYQPPVFTVEVFFLLLMTLLCLSVISFTLLNYSRYCKKEHVIMEDNDHIPKEEEFEFQNKTEFSCNYEITYTATDLEKDWNQINKHRYTKSTRANKNNNVNFKSMTAQKPSNDNSSVVSSTSTLFSNRSKKRMSKTKYGLFLFLTAYLNGVSNGVLPSIQTYSCLPYGIRAYHMSVTLSSIANPVSCFATFFLCLRSIKSTVFCSVVGSLIAGYIMCTAVTSPTPPLIAQPGGGFVVILSWILVVFIVTYTKVSIATVFRLEGRRALLWVGASTQLGSLVGALVTFFLVNYYKLFHVANPCV